MTDQHQPSRNDAWLTRSEAASILRVSSRTIDRYAQQGHIAKMTTPTGLVRFRAEDVQALLQERSA